MWPDFSFYIWIEKRSGYLTIDILCCRIHRYCGVLITNDKPKEGVGDPQGTDTCADMCFTRLVDYQHLFLNQARTAKAPGFLKLFWSARRYVCVHLCLCVRPQGH